MKVAIFGSSGFFGGHLKSQLSQNVISVDIRDTEWKKTMPEDTKIFINCIGKAHDHDGKVTEKDYFIANYEIVKDVFQNFLNNDAELFIHISSIAAVEENERNEIITENSICNPVSNYGKSKRKAEEFLLSQNLNKEKKIVILRPCMIHGEGDKGNLNLLYQLISKGVPYPLGAFENSRTFLSIDNAVFFINEIIKQKNNIHSGLYNLTDDEPLSTKKIIEVIAEIKNRKFSVLYIPKLLIKFLARIGDFVSLPINSKRLNKMTKNLLVSNEKIKKELNISQLPLSAEKGMRKTIKSFN